VAFSMIASDNFDLPEGSFYFAESDMKYSFSLAAVHQRFLYLRLRCLITVIDFWSYKRYSFC